MDKLKPCPFCGFNDPMHTSNGIEQYSIGCNCGAEGPVGTREDEAQDKWNTRTSDTNTLAVLRKLREKMEAYYDADTIPANQAVAMSYAIGWVNAEIKRLEGE